MSNNLFTKNLQSLQKRYPDYAMALRSAPLLPTSQPVDTPFIESWLRKTYSSENKQVVLLGIGGGHAVEYLWNHTQVHLLTVIEKDLQNVISAMHRVDLTQLLEDECVHWVMGCHPQALEEGLLHVKSKLAANGFQVLRIPNRLGDEVAYYDAILKELPRIIEKETFSLRALLARGLGVQINIVRNFQAIVRSMQIDSIDHCFPRVPAIIVAAGPSLDKNASLLQGLNHRALLLCVDTAVKTVLPLGIDPHFIVTTDPTRENAKHFDNVEIPEKTILAYCQESCPDIIHQYQKHSRKLCLLDDSNWFNEHFRTAMGLSHLLPRPMHVGETAIRMAIMMGCDPIIFVGLDLAIPPHAKATHARASARAAQILSIDKNQAQIKDETGEIKTQELIPVPGIDGDTVLTYYSFKMYLDDLEQTIAKTPIRWIDATEGGALKKGSEVKSLHHVLSELTTEYNIDSVLDGFPFPSDAQQKKCVESFSKGIERLMQIKMKLERMQSSTISLEEGMETWNTLLNDKEIRALMDHALFPFQLEPKLHRIPQEEQLATLQRESQAILPLVQTFVSIWDANVELVGSNKKKF